MLVLPKHVKKKKKTYAAVILDYWDPILGELIYE